MKKVTIYLTVLLVALQAEARQRFTEQDRQRATNMGVQQATGISNNAQSGAGTTSTNYSTIEQSSKDTQNNSQKGQATARVMQVGMLAMGANYASSCSCLGNCYSCVMAAVMFYMGSQAGRAAGSFNGVIDASSANVCTYGSTGCSSTNPYTDSLTSQGVINDGKIKDAQTKITEALSKAGYAVDLNSGKVTSTNGNGPSADASNQSSLASTLGGDRMNELMNKVKEIEKDALKKVEQIKPGGATAATGFDNGGGSGASALGEGGYGDGTGGGAGGLAGKIARDRKPAQARGLTKNFNGDPIGVAADSIFEMMSRRYQLKNTQKTFLSAGEVH